MAEDADRVLPELSEEDKEQIQSTPRGSLTSRFHFGLGSFVRNTCGLWAGNDDLIEACARASHSDEEDGLPYYPFLHPDDSSAVIVEEVWRRLNV